LSGIDTEPRDPCHAGFQMGQSAVGTGILAAARLHLTRPEALDWSDAVGGLVDAETILVPYLQTESWAKPSIYDFRRNGDEWAIPCGTPVQIPDGRMALPMERHTKTYVSDWLRRYHAFCVFSRDEGATWGNDLPTLNDPDGRVAYYDQHFTVLTDGSLLSVAWAHDVEKDLTLTARSGLSVDGGGTWSKPRDTGIVGGPVSVITLPDGRVLALYARRVPPAGIRACISENGGRRWRTDAQFVIWDDTVRQVTGEPARDGRRPEETGPLWGTMWGWKFGSPTPLLAPDGTVLVTFACAEADGVRHVRCVRLEI